MKTTFTWFGVASISLAFAATSSRIVTALQKLGIYGDFSEGAMDVVSYVLVGVGGVYILLALLPESSAIGRTTFAAGSWVSAARRLPRE